MSHWKEDRETEREQTFAVSGECAVFIETTSGDVQVRGWERPQAQVTSDERVRVRQEGNHLHIHPGHGGTGDLVVHVPHACDLTAHVQSGDLDLQELHGRTVIQSMSGDIHARGLRGELQIGTASGDTSLRACHLERLTVDSASGDLLLESPLVEGGAYHVRTASGDLHLRLPAGQHCTLICNGLSGDIECHLPHEIRKQGGRQELCLAIPWGRREVLINGGGVPFQVDSVSGDIMVEASDMEAEQPRPADAHSEETPGAGAEPFGLDATAPVPAAEGAQPQPEPATAQDAKRMAILKAIEEGRMSVAEGLSALESLGD